MIKVFRPLWSLDVKKTEGWLSQMAAKGMHLKTINHRTRYFVFTEGSPKDVTYCIGYDRHPSLPRALQDNGWSQVHGQGKWYVWANDLPKDEIKTFPLRGGLIKRNNWLIALCSGLLIYLVTMLLMFSIIWGWVVFSQVPVTVEGSPLWILTPILYAGAFGFWGIVIYSFFTLLTANKKLGEVPDSNKTHKGKLVFKSKFLWWYAPDRLETWLEGLDAQGFKLEKVGRISFGFANGSPRKVKYVVDYQSSVDQGYYDIHKENGWTLHHSSKYFPGYWSIWSQEFQGQVAPELYSQGSDALDHARRLLLMNSLLLIPVAFFLLTMPSRISSQLARGVSLVNVSNVILIVLILEFGTFFAMSLGYYLRTKKRFNHTSNGPA